tara:strand:+ start:5743 stop:9840 length:4098 start_codon:yes stop_codon:yes gene_type:complete
MNDEIDYAAIARDAGKFMDQNLQEELDIQPKQPIVEEEQKEDDSQYMVDGQDLRNHPQYEYLRLDIPWQEGEGGWGYQKNFPEIYKGKEGTMENAQIFLQRKHALKGDIPMEIRNSIYKGGIDLVSSVLTFPERLVDMTPFVGQMKRGPNGEMINRYTGEKYELDWDPLKNVKDPWQNAWWGTLVQGVTKYGLGARLARGAGVKGLMKQEAIVAGMSEYSQGDNVSGQIAERLPWTKNVFGAIATNDYDSPLMLTLKNVLEELTLGKVFDHLLGVHNPKNASAIVKARNANVDDQIIKKGAAELAEELEYDKTVRTQQALPTSAITKQGDVIDVDVIPDPAELAGRTDDLIEGTNKVKPTTAITKSGMRGHKNKPIAQPGQGSPTSNYAQGNLFGIHRQLNRIDNSIGVEKNIGSTDSVMSPLQAEKAARDSGYSTKFLQQKAKELLGEEGFKAEMKKLRDTNASFRETFQPAYDRMQEIMGRNRAAETSEEFWEPILRDKPAETGTGAWSKESYKYWSEENVLVADLVIGSLFKEMRNLGIAGKELIGEVDVWAADGLMQSLEDRLIFGLTEVKRARYFSGSSLQKLKGPAYVKAVNKATKQIHGETVDGVRLMMQMMKDSKSDELAEAILEVFQVSNKIQNWQDFDAFLRAKVMGGEFKGKQNVGAVIEELQSFMINSILSSPKTPLRAIIGTTSNAYLNSINQLIGATMRMGLTGDTRLFSSSLAHTRGMFELIPEALKVFKTNLDANFSKPLANVKTRFSEFDRSAERKWNMYGKAVEERFSKNPNKVRAQADAAAWRISNVARTLNNNKLYGWSPRTLASIDDTFRHLMGRAKSKEQAFKQVYDAVDSGTFKEITPELLKNAEDLHFSQYFDEVGDYSIDADRALQYQFREATLTQDIDAFGRDLEGLFSKFPLIRPFFLFARTGVNGLKMNVKNMPLMSLLLQESRVIVTGTAAKLKKNPALYAKYGIETIDDLKQAQNLFAGRQAMGSAVVAIASQKYLAGELTGNGPINRQQRAMWSDTGWERKTMSFGGVRIGYQAFEPFDLIFSHVADVGDHMKLMGPEWAEGHLWKLVNVLGQGMTTKSYLQGITDLVDIVQPESTKGWGRVVGNIANNFAPLPIGGSMRNDIGKILNPYMRELNKDLIDSIRNRNLATERLGIKGFTGKLPVKYDILNGRPLRDWNFIESIFNAVSPVSFSLKPSPGRDLLHRAGYDLRTTVTSAPGNLKVNLNKSNVARSLFQQAIGNYKDGKGRNLEEIFNEYADPELYPEIANSIAMMQADLKAGERQNEPRKYTHNIWIQKAFERAKKKAWASIQDHPEIIRLVQEAKDQKIRDNEVKRKTSASNFQEKATIIRQLKNK